MKRRLIENMGHRDCRWVTGDKDHTGRTLYCAETTVLETEYCPNHYKLMYRDQAAYERHRVVLATIRPLQRVA